MKLRITSLVIIISLIAVFSALAEEKRFEGEVKLTPTFADISGNEAKFNEYRDTEDGFGLFSKLKLGYDSGSYYFKFKAADAGYDTQSYRLDGGMWGKFRYNLFYKEIPHNITNDARSFYSGIGSANLTGTENLNVDTWNKFDYEVERKQYGGSIGFDLLKPFFFSVGYSREERDGIKPTAANLASPGGAFIELPEPVDYVTNTLKAEAGYATKPFFAAVSLFYSTFENDKEILSFEHPTANTTDRLSLPPDNEYYKAAFKSNMQLPFNSRFNVNLGLSRTRSDFNLIRNWVNENVFDSASYTDTKFDGRIDTKNSAFVLTSNPVPFLNAKVFYKYYEKENKSDEITETNDNITNQLFEYKKNNAGIELGFKLPANFYLTTAYNYVKIDREREDIPKTTDDIYSIDLKWGGLDFMTARVGYERLERDGDFNENFPAELQARLTAEGSPDAADARIEQYVRRYDAASQDRDTFKVGVDLYPGENFNVGLEYRYRKSDFDDTILGIREDKGNEFGISADYTFGKFMTVAGFFDYEKTRTYQFQRRFNNASTGSANGSHPDPSGTQNVDNYNWDVTQRDESFDYGIGADVFIIPKKVTLRLRYDYLDSNGEADFTYYNNAALTAVAGRSNDSIDINNWDDYKKSTFMGKIIYNASKSMTLSVGYAHERFKYNDAALDNYNYKVSANGQNYLTGAYSDPNYSANVVFASVAYRF